MVLAEELAIQSEGLRMRLRLRDVLALASVAYLLCISGKILIPRYYTDIYYVYWAFVLATHNGIPYHAYSSSTVPAAFVYPAIPAILIWVSGFAPSLESYMAVMALLTFPFIIGAVYFLYRICVEFRMDRGRIIPFFVMAPSFLLMSFDSWDIIAVSLVVAALYHGLKKKPRLTGLCLGLGFAAKNFPLLLLPAFLKEEQTWRGRSVMLLTTVIGGLVPNLPFMIMDFPGWFRTVVFPFRPGAGLYLENSIWVVIRYYRLITQDWLIVAVTWSLIILGILHVTFSSKPFVLKLWLILAVTILVFPTYPPQYNVWLLPLFALNPIFSLVPFLAFDFLDNAVGLAWFTVSDPFQPWGPIWDISLLRIGLLALLLAWASNPGSAVLPHLRGYFVAPFHKRFVSRQVESHVARKKVSKVPTKDLRDQT
jgi:uncharacterized membrane protein